MGKIFFTSDQHFFDNRFEILFRDFKSQEQYTKTIIENWNNTVGKFDTVYCLGDIVYGNNPLNIISNLHGVKHLIKGNHDKHEDDEYLKYFKTVKDNIILKTSKIPLDNNESHQPEIVKLYLNHYPVMGEVYMWNLCGHIHGSWRHQKNIINVSVDCWNFKPVSLGTIMRLMDAIENYYDEDVWAAYNQMNTEYMDRGKKGSYSDG